MPALPALFALLALVGLLAMNGGAVEGSRLMAMGCIGFGLLASVLVGGGGLRSPRWGWWACLFLPPVAVILLQALPLGWQHPWIAADCAALGVPGPGCWAIDPDAAWRAVAWAATVAACAWLALLGFRGERMSQLAAWLVGIAAVHAALGIVLAPVAPEWPSVLTAGRVRGTFIYPNHAATFWAACLPVALCAARDPESRRGWWLGGAAVLALATVLSASRGGTLVMLVVSAPLAWTLLPRRHRLLWGGLAGCAIAAWLVTIGIDEVRERYERLAGPEGVSLSGRVTIWQSAWPVVQDAGAFGSGAGSTPWAFLRSGDTNFPGLRVFHLHNDWLEWLLEYGWAGAAATGAGLLAAAILAWRAVQRQAPQRALGLGAFLGLATLVLHGAADFVFHREAVAVLAALLAVLAVGALEDGSQRPVRAAWRWRVAALAVLALVATAAWIERPRGAADSLASNARRAAGLRQRQGLPAEHHPEVIAATQAPLATPRIAVLQAELALSLPGEPAQRRERADHALRAVATMAPASPEAWAQRVRLHMDSGTAEDRAGTATALRRLLAWAPGWSDGLAVAARALAADGGELLPAADAVHVAERLLAAGLEQPPWFFPLAARLLGPQRVAASICVAPPPLASSGERWLAANGTLEQWIALRRRLAPADPPACAVQHHLLLRELLGAGAPDAAIAGDPAVRRDQAEGLRRSGQPQPPALVEAMTADGAPWQADLARTVAPGQAWDRSWLEAQAAAADRLRSWLHLPWVRQAWEESLAARALLAGDAARLGPGWSPPWLAAGAALAAAPEHRGRCEELLALMARPDWQEVPGGRATWLWRGRAIAQAPVASPVWVGLAVDGCWQGWRRGRFDAAEGIGPGLHRLTVLVPP